MQRLLQADVGAGKTAVAVYALLVAVANQHQAVFMAPTEVLAQQHWRTLENYLAQSRVRRLLLTGALTTKERKAALADIREGRLEIRQTDHFQPLYLRDPPPVAAAVTEAENG